jgi:GH15 family glucan-1,4-alpha-glucosidase
MFWLMFRNVASDGLVFDDPVNAGIISSPGCVLAAPSWENTATHVTQDYVYHWTRDAAIVALELSAAYQFDAETGFEKSVSNLSWSYAAFLSAVRARG